MLFEFVINYYVPFRVDALPQYRKGTQRSRTVDSFYSCIPFIIVRNGNEIEWSHIKVHNAWGKLLDFTLSLNWNILCD